MRKRFRVVQNKFGYFAELNTRWMINSDTLSELEDNWLAIGGTRETIEEAKHDIQDWKDSIDINVVYEE